ncbi:MAG: hypothetical protein OEQ53_08710 [Saprospiraceae bacterium]|nr:hypothetical protein [Saprospiraceae bacterium]
MLHTSIKPWRRADAFQLAWQVDSLVPDLSEQEYIYLQWMVNENNDWLPVEEESQPQGRKYVDSTRTFYTLSQRLDNRRLEAQKSRKTFLKHFYRTPAHLFELNKANFQLKINPLLNFGLAKAKGDSQLLFQNQRGIAIRGRIDEHVYFYTEVLESQSRYAEYVVEYTQRFKAVPGAGFFKNYRSSIFNIDNGVDFLLSNAYVGTRISRHVHIEFGHGRNFIGNGIRSLLLSDFSPEYFYLKFNTRVWKFHYQNIFAELLRPRERTLADRLLPKKYFAAHHLSLHLTPNFNIGLYEAVVFARENQFELQYLNPIILYRSVEGAIGSPDNVLIGVDLKWNVFNHISMYGQFVLDEFKLGELTSGNGWWANKYGIQLGAKYVDVFNIPFLNMQVEYNSIRPYTYSHNDSTANYSHYNQSLAHPLGSNLRELLVRCTYRPGPRWTFRFHSMFATSGKDPNGENWGSNILLLNQSHVQDFGNEIGQGISTQINLFGFEVSYRLKPGMYFEVYQQRRSEESETLGSNSSTYFGAAIRWNLGRRWLEF